jgi:hypothetical protein
MYQTNLFNSINNVNMQIQNKRRKEEFNGMWGAPINFFVNQSGNQNCNQNNNGWGQQGTYHMSIIS